MAAPWALYIKLMDPEGPRSSRHGDPHGVPLGIPRDRWRSPGISAGGSQASAGIPIPAYLPKATPGISKDPQVPTPMDLQGYIGIFGDPEAFPGGPGGPQGVPRASQGPSGTPRPQGSLRHPQGIPAAAPLGDPQGRPAARAT